MTPRDAQNRATEIWRYCENFIRGFEYRFMARENTCRRSKVL